MAKQEIREPEQKRSIEKKQNIIGASYKLFSDRGYYKTGIAEIAQEVSASTGVVYSYFQDEKGILLEAIKLYISLLGEWFQPLLCDPVNKENIPGAIKKFLDISISSHTMNVETHNEFLALSLFEKEIFVLFSDFGNSVLSKLSILLMGAGFSKTGLLEKLRICCGIVERVRHGSIQRKQTPEELDTTKSLAIHIIIALLNDTIRMLFFSIKGCICLVPMYKEIGCLIDTVVLVFIDQSWRVNRIMKVSFVFEIIAFLATVIAGLFTEAVGARSHISGYGIIVAIAIMSAFILWLIRHRE